MRIPLSFGHTEKYSKNVNAGKCINMFPVVNSSDSKNQLTLTNTPGLEPWVLLEYGEVRGMYLLSGTIYAVASDGFYSVDINSETATLLGNIQSSSGKVWIEYNAAPQLMICDGANGYVYDFSTLSKITDSDFPGCSSLSFLDNYGIISEPNTGRMWNSNLNNFSAWLGTDYVTADGNPDYLISVFADHREAWLFGEKTTEVYRNTGDPDAVFQRINGTIQEVGIAAAASVAKQDNVILWLDHNLLVRMAQGYSSVIISTPAISRQIQQLGRVDDAIGFTYTQNGHSFYVLTFPSDNFTCAYDIGESTKAQTPLWHVRSSGVVGKKWRGNCVVENHGIVYVGDFQNGYIHKLKDNVFTDNATATRREWTTQEVFEPEERRTLFHDELEIEVEAGTGLSGSSQGSDPEIMMQYSDDGGHTWSYESWRTIGKIGEYKNRARWQTLGKSRNRIYKFAISDSVKTEAISAYVKVSPGTE